MNIDRDAITSLISRHPLFGCGCCTSWETYDEQHPDGCPDPDGDGWIDHTDGPGCSRERDRAGVIADAVIALIKEAT